MADPKGLSQSQALGPAFKPLTAFGLLSPKLSSPGMQILSVGTGDPEELPGEHPGPLCQAVPVPSALPRGLWCRRDTESARLSPPRPDPKTCPQHFGFLGSPVFICAQELGVVVAETRGGDNHLHGPVLPPERAVGSSLLQGSFIHEDSMGLELLGFVWEEGHVPGG